MTPSKTGHSHTASKRHTLSHRNATLTETLSLSLCQSGAYLSVSVREVKAATRVDRIGGPMSCGRTEDAHKWEKNGIHPMQSVDVVELHTDGSTRPSGPASQSVILCTPHNWMCVCVSSRRLCGDDSTAQHRRWTDRQGRRAPEGTYQPASDNTTKTASCV